MNSIKLISSSKNFCPRFNGKLLSRYSNPKAYADSCIPFFICQNVEEKIWVALSNFFFPFHQCKTENTIVINVFACKEHFLQGKQGKTTPFFSVLQKKKKKKKTTSQISKSNKPCYSRVHKKSKRHSECGTSQHNLWLRKLRKNVGRVIRIFTEFLLWFFCLFDWLISLSPLIASFAV